jgi:Icc-related predicted phosphoesterase
MNIVAISDIHSTYNTLEKILQKEKNADLVLIVGDISTHGTAAEIRIAMEKTLAHGKQILAVAGNMDVPESDNELLRMGISLNARGVQIGDVGFFGVSAAPLSPLHTPYELTEEEIARRIESGFAMIRDAPVKIFVPHSPPYQTKLDRIFLGTHVGSRSIRIWIDQHQPDIVVCGHIHEARGQDTLGKTKMINCGAAQRGFYARITVADDITLENCKL